MPPTPHKLTSSFVGGFSVLVLQALTAPLAVVRLVSGIGTEPRWMTALYFGLELSAMVSAILLAWGLRTRHANALYAPAALLLPFWLAIAVSGPVIDSGVAGLLFAGFAVSMGAITSVPFVMSAGRSRAPAAGH
jgi:hypothetical protein